MKKNKCWGSSKEQHIKGCHPGRPLCRYMRRVRMQRQKCTCSAYWFPHRFGGGLCGKQDERMNAAWKMHLENRG